MGRFSEINKLATNPSFHHLITGSVTQKTKRNRSLSCVVQLKKDINNFENHESQYFR